jgi:hypothetical protein
MISNNDPHWTSLEGGYRVPYDPRPAVDRLRTTPDDARAWQELWENLHHQGDLGVASYAAVVALARLRESTVLRSDQLFGLVSTIEVERHRRTNPPVPDWLMADYADAWRILLECALGEVKSSTDPQVLQSALAVVGLAKGLIAVGALLWYHDQSTLREYLEEHLAWTDLYARKAG